MYELYSCNPSYLLLPAIEVRTDHVSYGPSYFFPSIYGTSAKRTSPKSKGKRRGSVTDSTDWRDEGRFPFDQMFRFLNSGNSMRRMEQYLPVGWTNPSTPSRSKFSVLFSRKQTVNWPLKLLDDSEVETYVNDVLGEDEDKTFISVAIALTFVGS